ncbi:MAG: AraC family transcriptional regulator [Clostridia bacterium]|nr:AraC family transcriptional regulator [Clostridia bacterium]
MNWLTGIQNAIDYIEDHLAAEIDYEEVAKRAYCSNFYFQKLFTILCGISLGEYIRNRRLTLAGAELRAGNGKVIDVALKYGYESPESFTRAFVKFHGVTPSEVKRKGAQLKSFSRFFVKVILSGGSVMDYKIVEKEAFTVLEKVEKFSVVNGQNLREIPKFWDRTHTDGTVETLLKYAADEKYVFGVCYGNTTKEDPTFEYSIAVQCDENAPVPDGYRKRTLPQRTWVTFGCRGAMPDAIQALWTRITTEFFPVSEYAPTLEFEIEAYPDGDTSDENYYSEIWLPVERKN